MLGFLSALLKFKHRKSPEPSKIGENHVDSANLISQTKTSVSASSKESKSSIRNNALSDQSNPNSQPTCQDTPQSITQHISQIEKCEKAISVIMKQFLDVLLKWSQQQALTAQVLDVYNCLENEFDILYAVFAAINLDALDLEHYAELLFMFLKKILSHEASVGSSENNLDQICCLTNNLLLSLKFKLDKLRHKLIRDDKGEKSRLENNEIEHIDIDHNISSLFSGREKTISDLPIATIKEETVPLPHIHPPVSSKNAFAALERRGILKRSVSRIYSTDQASQPLCISHNSGQNISDELYENNNTSPASNEYQILSRPLTTLSQNDLTLFLQYKKSVKKFVLSGGYTNLSIVRLQLAFIENFDWNRHHTGVTLPRIYIQDPLSGIRYELEHLSDVKDRSVLFLNVEGMDETKCDKDEGLSDIRQMIEDIKTAIDEQHATIQQVTDRQQEMAKNLSEVQTTVSSISREINHRATQNCTIPGPNSMKTLSQNDELEGINRDLTNLRQSFSSYQFEIQDSIKAVRKVSEDFQLAVAETCSSDSINDYGRKHVEDKKKNINQECDKLVGNVDGLLIAVKDLRLDVAVRGVEPLPRRLQTVSKDIALADVKLKKMKEIISGEKPIWTQTWDEEMQRVRDDRENMKIYEGLVDELQDDITKASRILALVKLVLKEKIKVPQVSKSTRSAI